MNPINPPPSLNAHGGFGNEVGPRAQTLCPRPDDVINKLSRQLTTVENELRAKDFILINAQLRNETLTALVRRCESALEHIPLTFNVVELLNDIERELK